jgi:uncharacterized protein
MLSKLADRGRVAGEAGCMDQNRLQEKKAQLAGILKKYERLVIAFSGGVDSSFLLAMACKVLGDKVTAVTAESPVHPLRERKAAADLALALQVDHVIIQSHEMELPDFLANPENRCYICKRHVFGQFFKIAAKLDIETVAHGVNLDDLSDYRPGQQAAEELGVPAPLVEAGLTKKEIRLLSREMGLPTWDKPSMACLASRIPYGSAVTPRKLSMVEAAEGFLLQLGVKTCRVRHHGSVARIEIDPADFDRALAPKNRIRILNQLKKIGFVHVALDLKGYTMGSMNREITKQVD